MQIWTSQCRTPAEVYIHTKTEVFPVWFISQTGKKNQIDKPGMTLFEYQKWFVMVEGYTWARNHRNLCKDSFLEMNSVTCTSSCELFRHLPFLSLDALFHPIHNLCSCSRLFAALVFQPALWCGLCKEQITLRELYCLKLLVQPKQTGEDKREWSGPGLRPGRHVLNIHGCFCLLFSHAVEKTQLIWFV